MTAFVFGSAALFAVGAAITLAWASSMPDVCGGAPMAWMPMPSGTWAGSSAAFLAMWMAMMVPMMMPSLAPALWRYRHAIAAMAGRPRPASTLAAGAGYFFVWTLLGLAVQPMQVVLARAGTPWLAGAIVLGAGFVQLGAWKRRQLARCRACTESWPPTSTVWAAWLHGMHLGAHCVLCCGNLMAIVLVAGMANPWVMAGVTAAITVERVARRGPALAQATGVVVIGAGLVLIGRAPGW